MTKVTGIDIGRAWIHLVEVDGSARKYTVSKVCSVPRSPDADHVGLDLARAFEESGAVRNRALLAVPGNLCTFRNLDIPFKGIEAIRKVLKFEAESVIHSHAIDDIIVDGVPLVEDQDGTEIFMAACPKDDLRNQMAAVKAASVEAEVFDLDVTLLVQAAANLGHFREEPEREEDGAIAESEGAEPQPADSSQVIIGLGSQSTTLILVKGGKLLTARVLRWGVDHLIRSLARALSVSPVVARASLNHHLGLEVPTPALAEARETAAEPGEGEFDVAEGGSEASEGVSRVVDLDADLLQQKVRALSQALVRELTRFLAGTKGIGDPAKLLVTGGGGLLPGFMDSLEEESGVPVEALDLLGCAPEVTPEIGELEPQLDLAFAAALAGLGTTHPSMNFRAEDLVYKRKFEQLKFPLATLVLAVAIALFFLNILDVKALGEIERSMGVWIENPRAAKTGKKLPPGYASPRGILSAYVYNSKSKTKYQGNSQVGRVLSGKKQQRALYNKLQSAGRFDRVSALRSFLRNEKRLQGKSTGYFPELKLESGVAVWQAFSAAVAAADQDPEIKRFIIPEMDLQVGTTPRNRWLTFTVAFEGREDFRQQNALFDKHMKAACDKGATGDGSPFESVDFKFGKIKEEGIYGGEYSYEFKLKPSFDVFQPVSR